MDVVAAITYPQQRSEPQKTPEKIRAFLSEQSFDLDVGLTGCLDDVLTGCCWCLEHRRIHRQLLESKKRMARFGRMRAKPICPYSLLISTRSKVWKSLCVIWWILLLSFQTISSRI